MNWMFFSNVASWRKSVMSVYWGRKVSNFTDISEVIYGSWPHLLNQHRKHLKLPESNFVYLQRIFGERLLWFSDYIYGIFVTYLWTGCDIVVLHYALNFTYWPNKCSHNANLHSCWPRAFNIEINILTFSQTTTPISRQIFDFPFSFKIIFEKDRLNIFLLTIYILSILPFPERDE